MPLLQVDGAVQARPHMPQLAVSLWVLTQVDIAPVPQRVSPVGQAQAPIVQVCPLGHTVPQAPQLALSLAVSTQAMPQALRPVGQPQRPAVHT
jgi:hypothetical protein